MSPLQRKAGSRIPQRESSMETRLHAHGPLMLSRVSVYARTPAGGERRGQLGAPQGSQAALSPEPGAQQASGGAAFTPSWGGLFS